MTPLQTVLVVAAVVLAGAAIVAGTLALLWKNPG